MIRRRSPRGIVVRAFAPLAVIVAATAAVRPSAAAATALGSDDSTAVARAAAARDGLVLDDSLFGRSGKLRARFVARRPGMEVGAIGRLFADSATATPGVYAAPSSARPFSLVSLVPFEQKVAGRVEGYRMGFWPGERRAVRSAAYVNPAGFIRVTPENASFQVSEHFRLRDFLTKDQHRTWPKYLVLRAELVDKLELVIDDLAAHGVPVTHMAVMSGFRTPQYNQQGVGAGGRAQDSRHQFGDAADVFVDNDRNGRMDDVNRDGRIDTRDAQVIIDAAARVEARFPELLGGLGRYRANSAHGPFVHVDVRGSAARWGNG